jgi:putrescine aminotransferase
VHSLYDRDHNADSDAQYIRVCLEFVADKTSRSAFPDGVDIEALMAEETQKLGLIVRSIGNLNVISPALIITKAEID